MSITDELREYIANQQWCANGTLSAIADRIDAEHQKATRELNNLAGASVLLPIDADGVPFRIGDKVDSDHYEDGTVTGIQYGLAANGAIRELVAVRPHGWDTATWHDPEEYAHHHEPTVEDVLREFAEKMNENMGMYTGEAIDADEWREADARTVEKYAAKLRLAGEE